MCACFSMLQSIALPLTHVMVLLGSIHVQDVEWIFLQPENINSTTSYFRRSDFSFFLAAFWSSQVGRQTAVVSMQDNRVKCIQYRMQAPHTLKYCRQGEGDPIVSDRRIAMYSEVNLKGARSKFTPPGEFESMKPKSI